MSDQIKIQSNMFYHASAELEALVKSLGPDDCIIKPFIPEIIALCEKFGQSGQSGGSAPFVASAIKDVLGKLLKLENLTPITGDESEWMDVQSGPTPLFQNKRLSSVFKIGKEGKPYYLDAIVWKEGNTSLLTGTALLDGFIEIKSSQYVKLPFTPKTFYIEVVEKGEEYHIVDKMALEKARAYYDMD